MPSSVLCSTRSLWNSVKSSSSFTVRSTGRPRCIHQLLWPSPRCRHRRSLCLCHFCCVLVFFRVVVHVMFDMVVVERDVILVFACCGEYGTSTMPSTSFIRCHHTVAHYVSFAHSFDFFCFRFSIFANCSCCCCVLFFRSCFPCFTYCLRCGIICGERSFPLFFNDLLVFFRAQASRLQCFFLLGRVHHTQSCLVFLYS